MYRILLLDDEPGVLSALSRLLRHSPLTIGDVAVRPKVEAFLSARDALACAAGTAFDLAVSDFRMPEMDGVAVLRKIRELQPDCARVILSGYADLNGLVAGINEARIDRFIAKPWNDFEFISALSQILQIRALRLENDALADQMRLQRGMISPAQMELQRLERLEPGITQVKWADDGSVVMDLDDDLLASQFPVERHAP